jgi:ADP-heptose:LPS heptosyltransferase
MGIYQIHAANLRRFFWITSIFHSTSTHKAAIFAPFMEHIPSQPVKVLVIRMSSMGDIVLTTPVLRALHTQLTGEVEIHYLCKQRFAGLLEANPRIQRIHTFDKTVQEVLPALEQEQFDYVIDLHRNIRSAVVKRRLKTLSFTFDKLNFKKWLLVHTGLNLMPRAHVVDRYMDTLKAFGVQDDGKGLEYDIPHGQGLSEQHLAELPNQPFIVVVIGGAHAGKRPSPRSWVQWLRTVQQPIVLIGGKEDIEDANNVVGLITCQNWVGQLSIHQSADVLRRAALVVTGDTGMMHIAAAFGRKIISIWGCTTPSLGMSPYRPHPASIILEPMGRKRRPCSKLGNRCKYGMHHKCADQITAEQFREAIETSWAP